MKRIKFEKIKVGDYIKAVISDKQYAKNKDEGYPLFWKSTYFQVRELLQEDMISGYFFIDFDYGNRFLRTLKRNDNVERDKECKHFFILTENEYLKKFGKYVIIGSFEEEYGKN